MSSKVKIQVSVSDRHLIKTTPHAGDKKRQEWDGKVGSSFT